MRGPIHVFHDLSPPCNIVCPSGPPETAGASESVSGTSPMRRCWFNFDILVLLKSCVQACKGRGRLAQDAGLPNSPSTPRQTGTAWQQLPTAGWEADDQPLSFLNHEGKLPQSSRWSSFCAH